MVRITRTHITAVVAAFECATSALSCVEVLLVFTARCYTLRAWLCHSKSSVCPSICPSVRLLRSGTVIT